MIPQAAEVSCSRNSHELMEIRLRHHIRGMQRRIWKGTDLVLVYIDLDEDAVGVCSCKFDELRADALARAAPRGGKVDTYKLHSNKRRCHGRTSAGSIFDLNNGLTSWLCMHNIPRREQTLAKRCNS